MISPNIQIVHIDQPHIGINGHIDAEIQGPGPINPAAIFDFGESVGLNIQDLG